MLNIKKITAGIMTALLLTGMLGTTAMAETKEPFTVTKNLVMDENVTEYPAFDFTIDVEPIDTEDELNGVIGYFDGTILKNGENEITGANKTNTLKEMIVLNGNGVTVPTLGDVQLSFANNAGTVTTDTDTKRKTVTVDNQISFDGVNFPKAGLYLYQLTETALGPDSWKNIAKSDTDELISQSDEKYILVVSVVNDKATNNLKVSEQNSFILHSKTEGGVTTYDKSEAIFTNVYKRGSTITTGPDDYDLKIQKTVTGQYGDQTKDFNFNITLTNNATEELREGGAKTEYKAQKYNANGTTEGAEFSISVGAEYTFTLKHGQYILLKDFPVGSSYQLAEKEEDRTGYQTTATVTVNGEATQNVEYNTLSGNNYTIGQGENSVNVTNDASLVLTGIVTDNLSFILLIVIAVAGMTAYVVLKRRLKNR